MYVKTLEKILDKKNLDRKNVERKKFRTEKFRTKKIMDNIFIRIFFRPKFLAPNLEFLTIDIKLNHIIVLYTRG